MTTDTSREALISRAKSYIERTSQGEAAAIRNAVEQGHEQLGALVDGLSSEQATFKPASDVWSVLEVLRHVVTAKHGVARICERLARGETVSGFGAEGERQQDGVMGRDFASLAEAREAMDAAHNKLLAFIDGPLATGNLDARYKHFIFGDLNCREWAAFQRVHDGDHSGQIAQVKSATGFPS